MRSIINLKRTLILIICVLFLDPVAVSAPHECGFECVIHYDYNSITNRKEATYTDDTRTEYEYDVMGRLAVTRLVMRDGNTVDPCEETFHEYTPAGSRDWTGLANGTDTEYTYNALNRLTNVTHISSLSETLSSFTYTLAADGMRTSVTEFIKMPSGAGEPNETRTINYTYDNLNRIIFEDANDSSDTYGYLGSYTYDIVGNRVQRTVDCNSLTLVTDYTYDANTDRLIKEVHDEPECSFIWNDRRVYAYAGNGGGRITHYRIHNSDKDIGHVKAFFIGLPSKWSPWLFYAALILVPLMFISPVIAGVYVRMRKRQSRCVIKLSLYHRCVLVFLAYALLIGPFGFESLSEGATLYRDLATTDWASGDRLIEYEYDDNGSQTKKTTKETSTTTVLETTTYEYNLQNRMSRMVTSYEEDSNDVNEVAEYTYNDAGIRVSKHYWTEIDGIPEGDDVTTVYLVDSRNHTGYAQTLEEMVFNSANPDPRSDEPDNRITYTIGDDVITQYDSTNGAEHLLYDGHGSTRQIMDDATEAIVDTHSYDAYGVMLGGNPAPGSSPATNLLYSGEHFDTDAQNYYLRARWYNQNNGRFNKMDTFAGNKQDPQSLHKYLYAHCNPVMYSDPSGKLIGGIVDIVNAIAIRIMLFGMEYGPTIAAGLWMAIEVTAAMWMLTLSVLLLEELGVFPPTEYVAEIAAILGVVLIVELMVFSMLPANWKNPPPLRGANHPKVKKALDSGNYVHYDKTTDPSKYTHEGGPTQLQNRYPNTTFKFAKRGQSMVDVEYISGPHPSSYPGSNWQSGINKADFKPDTVTGRAFKLANDILRIFYNPETREIIH